MTFERFIGSRYLRSRQKQTFISLITLLSVSGVTVGVMALIVVIAVMAGFEHDLKARILGVESHVVVMRHGSPFTDYGKVAATAEQTEGVEAATPFVYSQAMLRSSSGVSGAIVRGIDPATAGRVIQNLDGVSFEPGADAAAASPAVPEAPGIVLGKELARNLGVLAGDPVYLVTFNGMISPIGHIPSMKRFQVTGFFESGMHEFDGSLAYMDLREAQKILRMGDAVTGVEVRIRDIYDARRLAEKIENRLGFPYWTRNWMQMNRNLFSALKLEKTVMFIILTLIVLTGKGNVCLGFRAGQNETGSNKLYIHNSEQSDPLIFGEFDARMVKINGSLQLGEVASSSDVAFKKNIEPLEQPLEKITNLRGVSFEWRTEEFSEKGFREGRQIGLVAQEVERVLPEIVRTDKEGRKSLSYEKLTAVLVEAIKDQQAQIAENLSRLSSQQAELNAQRVQIEELKEMVRQLVSKKV